MSLPVVSRKAGPSWLLGRRIPMRANRFLRSHASYRHIWQAGLCASTGVASGSDRRSPTVAAATWAAKSICSSPLRSCSSYLGIGTVAVGAREVAAEAPPFVEINAPLLEQLECARVANKPALSSTFRWEGLRVSRLVLQCPYPLRVAWVAGGYGGSLSAMPWFIDVAAAS